MQLIPRATDAINFSSFLLGHCVLSQFINIKALDGRREGGGEVDTITLSY
jgi:hypothetical protein